MKIEVPELISTADYADFVVRVLGLPVLLLKPGEKRPATGHGVKDATLDPEVVSSWFEASPGSNYGIRAGNGVVVMDVDVKEVDGYASLCWLWQECGKSPTLAVETPSQGGHFYYRIAEDLVLRNRVGLLPGIDIRATNGYTVGPGSVIGGVAYRFVPESLEFGFQPAPQALIDLIQGTPPSAPPHAGIPLNPGNEGDLSEVNTVLARLAACRWDNREQWIKIGMALHYMTNGNQEGLAVWDSFSRVSAKWEEGACARAWESFGKSTGRQRPVTLGTLIAWAREDSGDPNIGKSQNRPNLKCQCGERWTNPLPLTDFQAPEFPMDALPPTIRKMAEAASASVGIQLEMAVMAILAVLGAAVAKKAAIQVMIGYIESLNLYVLLIAEPGSGKSPLFKIILNPLHRHERDLVAAAQASFEPTDEQPVPKLPTLICSDGTPEALKSLLAENGGRLFLADTEEIAISTALGRYSGAPKIEVFLQAHDGDTIRVDRKGRPSEFIEEPLLSMLVCMQEGSLKDLGRAATVAARGLFARCLPVAPPSLIGQRPSNRPAIDGAVTAAYEALLAKLCRVPIPASATIIPLTEESATLYQQFLEWVEPKCRPTAALGERVKGWGAKVGSHLLRIAGILHVTWCEERKLPWTTPLGVETLHHAGTIVEFLIPHVQRMFAIACDDSEDSDAQFILDYLVDRDCRDTTEADLRRDTKHRFRGRFKRERFTAALDLLIEHGWLRRAPSERTGRPGRPASSVLEVNPKAFPT